MDEGLRIVHRTKQQDRTQRYTSGAGRKPHFNIPLNGVWLLTSILREFRSCLGLGDLGLGGFGGTILGFDDVARRQNYTQACHPKCGLQAGKVVGKAACRAPIFVQVTSRGST